MRILVVDDNPIHRASAETTLSGHEVVIISDYVSAEKTINIEHFDAVLIDLLMPVGSLAWTTKAKKALSQFLNQEMPIGWALALLAALRGTKYVAIVSDDGHHDHPASSTLDYLCYEYGHEDRRFNVNGTRLLLFNGMSKHPLKCTDCDGTEHRVPTPDLCQTCSGRGSVFINGKNWGQALEHLLDNTEWWKRDG